MLVDHLFLVAFSSFAAGVFALSAMLIFGDALLRKFSRKGRGGSDKALRFGGIAIALVFLLALLWDTRLEFTREFLFLSGAVVAMLIVGIYDDIRAISWKKQLFLQTSIIAIAVLGAGVYMTDIPTLSGERWILDEGWLWLGAIAAILWFLLIINSLNWIDGIDGLASGMVVIAGIALAILSLRPEVFQPPLAITGFALGGAFLALWLFNLSPAKLFMGTAGVYAAGCIIAYLSLVSGAKTATIALIFAIPILDALRVILQRYFSGKSPALPDTNHIHHELSRWGFSDRLISFVLLGITTLFAAISILFGPIGKIAFFALAAVAVFWLFRTTMNRR
jgi:UDP-GlcNAc:undecaprenyl-phosphate GlcNAc-1-phosphate transferase